MATRRKSNPGFATPPAEEPDSEINEVVLEETVIEEPTPEEPVIEEPTPEEPVAVVPPEPVVQTSVTPKPVQRVEKKRPRNIPRFSRLKGQ